MDLTTYQEYLNYLTTHQYPNRVHDVNKLREKNLKKSFRQMCKKFRICHDGKLMHCKFDKSNEILRVVPLRNDYLKILKSLHEDKAGGGHYGITATFNKIAERYWWPRISLDVKDFCKNCDECQSQNPIKKSPSELHPIPIPDRIFGMWGIDLVGPLHLTEDGNQYTGWSKIMETLRDITLMYSFFDGNQ